MASGANISNNRKPIAINTAKEAMENLNGEPSDSPRLGKQNCSGFLMTTLRVRRSGKISWGTTIFQTYGVSSVLHSSY